MLVQAFRALRPNAETAANVIAPPYDVVNTAEAKQLAANRPDSFLHVSRAEIDLPEGTDPYSDAVYRQAAKNFARLQSTGTLRRDSKRSIYIYRLTEADHVQTGVALTASVSAYDENRVRRHELTRPTKENDRVRHMESINAQTGPVLCAFWADPKIKSLIAAACNNEPSIRTIGPNDVEHSIWQIDSNEILIPLLNAFNALDALYIADGHHRSAAASRVAAMRRGESKQDDSNFEFFLTVAFPHDEMRIYDYNRVVTDLNGLAPTELIDRITKSFAISTVDKAFKPAQSAEFGMYLSGQWYRLTANNIPPSTDPVGSLDVSVLHQGLIEPILGISDPRSDDRVDFVGGIRGLGELEQRVNSGKAAVAFALFPTRMDQLMRVADAGLLMPPKSTWFEPKLADGLLSHVLD